MAKPAEKLRHGYTTGACAAAAAKAAAQWLLTGVAPETVWLRLPWDAPDAGEVAFRPVNLSRGEGWAAAGVVKDGGDDPDVTHGMELRAHVSFAAGTPGDVVVEGGEGVGRVTRPGLAVAPGQSAINPVPRRMIEAAARQARDAAASAASLRVVVSAPEGLARAEKTLNHRLGIVGGISILGTTGIVIPMSASAWTATIDACLDVARAAGSSRAVLAFGRTSEKAAHLLFPELAENAAALMGDHVGHALDAARQRDMDVVLAGQFAKFCKVAGGHFATHVKDSSLDLAVLSRLLSRCGFSAREAEAALRANTAREVYASLVADDRGLFALLALEVAEKASERAGGAIAVEAALFGYAGELLARAKVSRKEVSA